jgi:hypothetical protein
MQNWRKTAQYLMPAKKEKTATGEYDIYPTLRLEAGKIGIGFEWLAKTIAMKKC